MAQYVKKYRFLIVGDCDKDLRSLIYRQHHMHTTRMTTDFDAAIFTGGADVSPFLYGEKKLSTTIVDYNRDMEDLRAWRALGTGFPKIGICRGAQLLNVLSGGGLWQDVDNHAGVMHDIKELSTGRLVKVTSTHHQMIRPGLDAVVIAASNRTTKKLSDREVVVTPESDETYRDPEVVWYPDTCSLCFQGHPEYPNATKDFVNYFFETIEKYLSDFMKGR